MIEIYKTNIEAGILEQTTQIQKGVWINIVNPSKEEIDI